MNLVFTEIVLKESSKDKWVDKLWVYILREKILEKVYRSGELQNSRK